MRLYSGSRSRALQAQLAESAIAIAETETVAALRQRINDALDQRDAVLGRCVWCRAARISYGKCGPGRAAAVEITVQQIDVESLDDAALKDAAASSAKATIGALPERREIFISVRGQLPKLWPIRAEASKLLSEATNTTSALTRELADSGEGLPVRGRGDRARRRVVGGPNRPVNLGGAASSAAKKPRRTRASRRGGRRRAPRRAPSRALGTRSRASASSPGALASRRGGRRPQAARREAARQAAEKLPDLPGLPGQKKGPPAASADE